MRLKALLIGLALLVASCGGSDAGADTTTTTTVATTTTTIATTTTSSGDTTTTTTAPENPALNIDPTAAVATDLAGFLAQPTACGSDAPEPAQDLSFTAPEDLGLSTDPITVTIVTSCGDIVIEMDPAAAPQTVNSFVFLAQEGFFNGTVSHRIVPDFVIQAGDPTATGSGSPGYRIPDEPPTEGFLYARGVVAMANAGAGTTGSQFFIMTSDANLPPLYSVFGTVIEGFDVIDAINFLPKGVSARGEPSVPLETLYIEQVIVDL
ncbi:MAG: peptidylprolyl isomerase [Acidimicrobiia bacterium]|nr:peptidylprolyl isomerase [Acidimicrobiia bacterium]NNK92088.1 peptidylprolyl isomerase [Acidimicrobiia bacterium]